MDGTVSVIIPCFNQCRYLLDAIGSLQAQTYSNWEGVIVDDGSPDETFTIASRLCNADQRVRYVAKDNGGLSSARNAGILASHGEFIQFLDADDLLQPQKFEYQVKLLKSNPEVGIVYGNARYFYTDVPGFRSRGPYADHPDHDWINEAWSDERPMIRKLMDRNLFPVCSPLLRRSVCYQVGPFNEELDALEDWEYWVRCAINGVSFLFSDKVDTEALVRMHGESMTHDKERLLKAGFLFRMVCHEQLPSGEARNINLDSLLSAFSSFSKEDRVAGYERTVKACRSWQENLLVKICGYCDSKLLWGHLMGGTKQRISWRLRSKLVSIWLRYLS